MKRFSPYLIISLLASTLGFGATKGDSSCRPKDQCCPKTPKIEMAPAYSAPANVHLACKRDVWVDVSFIYWQPIGENLELGIADHNTGDSDAEAGTPLVGEVVNMDFRFKPGFQVGLGVDFGCDDWDAYAQYTYLRSTDTVTSEGFTPGQIHSLWVSPA
ncbi:MAG TPA: hypothetical protein VLF94_00235, partial [Chlamydiales bacterium]|nr:hypothetical protein [Chlamydiales bacterium]